MNYRSDFPIFDRRPGMVYLDSANTSQKPQCVIDVVKDYYERGCSNVHRGIYPLSVEADEQYEGAREKVRRFIGASSTKEVVFTKNATEAVNLVMHGWAKRQLKEGDVVLLSEMEHHANLVPWIQLSKEIGVELKFVPIKMMSKKQEARKRGSAGVKNMEQETRNEEQEASDTDFQLDMGQYLDLLESKKPKLVAVSGMSNVLGTVNDVKQICDLAHEHGARVLIDGAQLVAHRGVDVQDLDCDWLVFTGHKMLGPTGVGVLYGKEELLAEMPPFLMGGDMIRTVSFEGWTANELPWKFEAGTPNIAGVIGLGAAVDYLMDIGMDEVERIEGELTEYALEKLMSVNELKLFGPGVTEEHSGRGGIFSFEVEGVHAHDVAQILGEEGICVRAGHHCAMPLMGVLGTTATVRASLHIYNTMGDVDRLIEGLEKVKSVFG